MLQGRVWQIGGTRPFDDLSKADIKGELEARVCNKSITRPPTAVHLGEMNKKELQKELAEVHKGICNFPALVTSHPTKNMSDLNLQEYEIASPKPLHDFKGTCKIWLEKSNNHRRGKAASRIDMQISFR